MSKITGLYLVVLTAIVSSSFGQLGGTHNYLDTAYIAPRKLAEQQEFLQNKSHFPVKPRDMWQMGFYVGLPYIDGDCPWVTRGASTDLGSYAIGLGAYVRKSIGYAFSVRGSLSYLNMLGLDYKGSVDFANHPLIQQLYGNAPDGYVHNYRSMAFIPAVEGIVSFNNIMFHKQQQRWNFYGLVGASAVIYDTRLDLMDAKNNRYLVENILNNYHDKATIYQKLRVMFNGATKHRL
jgi:OmpA-OmpF porin, OOP family